MTNVTVCTPTYNRAHLLQRPFKSLLKQSCKNFIWLVVDDGSNDDTKSVVEELKKRADFPIEYVRKDNGGRHTALNFSYKFIKTPYVINLDSDDELTENAIELLEKNIAIIEEKAINDIWQISGLCIDSVSGKIVGELYPDFINDLPLNRQRKLFCKLKCEKSNCRKVEILKQYPFPEYPDTKFVTENTIWEKINQKYRSYCVNDVFRVYYQDSADSLGKGKIHSSSKMKSRYYYAIFVLNELFHEITYNKDVLFSLINIGRASIDLKISPRKVLCEMNALYKKILIILFGYPLGFIFYLYKDVLK